MRLSELLRESWATTLAARVPSALLLLVAAAMTLTPIVTVGKQAAAAAAVQDRLGQAGARRLIVIDTAGAGFINPATVSEVQHLSTVRQASALTTPIDTVNGVLGRGGSPAPMWGVFGSLDAVVTLAQGRWPREGEVIVSTTALRRLSLGQPAGYLTSVDGSQQWSVVGSFTPRPGYEDLATGVLRPAETTEPGRELRVTLDSVSSARITVAAVLSILDPPDARQVAIESPTALAQTALDINAQLASYARNLVLTTLVIGGIFVASVVFADVLVRRKDLGRRRTLGATRSGVVALVVIRTVMVTVLGSAVGGLLAWYLNRRSGVDTPIDFTVAIGVLTVLVAAVSSVVPAVFAARRDPVTVMRTP